MKRVTPVTVRKLLFMAVASMCISSDTLSSQAEPLSPIVTNITAGSVAAAALREGSQASSGASLSADAPTNTDRAPAFLGRGDIKGIDISPPVNEWDAATYGMTPVRLANLAAAGFNTHRVWISLSDFMEPPVNLDASVLKWVEYINRSVQAGFRAQVGMGVTWEEATLIVNDETTRNRFNIGLRALCRALGSYFSETQVALELLNEPPGKDRIPSYYSVAAPSWFKNCRGAAPHMTIILQPEMGWYDGLHEFDLADYDWNTMFSFHPYSPGEFTHQGIGNQPHLYNVPMPITRYVGGKKKMLEDVAARVNADPALSGPRKAAEIRRYADILDFLWWNDGKHWEDWTTLRQWIASTGINPKRIVAGEFGVVSEQNYNGTPALPDVWSRAHYMRKIKDQTEANNLAGWVVHQALGDFNLFRQRSHDSHLSTLIPELVTALFSADPLPEGPRIIGNH